MDVFHEGRVPHKDFLWVRWPRSRWLPPRGHRIMVAIVSSLNGEHKRFVGSDAISRVLSAQNQSLNVSQRFIIRANPPPPCWHKLSLILSYRSRLFSNFDLGESRLQRCHLENGSLHHSHPHDVPRTSSQECCAKRVLGTLCQSVRVTSLRWSTTSGSLAHFPSLLRV